MHGTTVKKMKATCCSWPNRNKDNVFYFISSMHGCLSPTARLPELVLLATPGIDMIFNIIFNIWLLLLLYLTSE